MRRKTKVLHVVGAMNRAGTETMLMNIYRNMNHEEVQFDFISYSDADAHYDQEIRSIGGKVIPLRKTNSITEIYQAIRKYGPYDVIHSHTLFHAGIANLAGFMAGVNIRIAHAHTTLDQSDSFIRKLYIALMRFCILLFSTHLLACSKGAGLYLFGRKGVNNKKYTYFPNPINYAQFLHVPQARIQKFKQKEGLENRIIIGHIGTFKEAKNHTFLVDIAKALKQKDPSSTVLLVGDGSLKEQMIEKSSELGVTDHILFAGIREDIPTLMHSMDVFVLPSLYEGLGLVLLEAQASGVPCVVSEAIQPEADVGLGLVHPCSLAKGPNYWAQQILALTNQQERNLEKIRTHFEVSGYSSISGISTLMQLYNVNKGGAYEKAINRLL